MTFGLDHLPYGCVQAGDGRRIAVVTDNHWIEGAVKLFAGLFRGAVRTFAVSQEAAAIAWAAAQD